MKPSNVSHHIQGRSTVGENTRHLTGRPNCRNFLHKMIPQIPLIQFTFLISNRIHY